MFASYLAGRVIRGVNKQFLFCISFEISRNDMRLLHCYVKSVYELLVIVNFKRNICNSKGAWIWLFCDIQILYPKKLLAFCKEKQIWALGACEVAGNHSSYAHVGAAFNFLAFLEIAACFVKIIENFYNLYTGLLVKVCKSQILLSIAVKISKSNVALIHQANGRYEIICLVASEIIYVSYPVKSQRNAARAVCSYKKIFFALSDNIGSIHLANFALVFHILVAEVINNDIIAGNGFY